MVAYFVIFALLIFIVILSAILGIIFRKKLPPLAVVCLIIFGCFTAIASTVMCLGLGFFMR